MKTDRTAIWAGLVLVLGVTAGCTKGGGPPLSGPAANRPYTIHLRMVNGQCVIDIPKLTVWLTDNTTITWRSDDAPKKTYKINFPGGSPFGANSFTTNDNPVTPQSRGNFLYSVTPDASTTPCIPATDPGIYIK